MNARDTDPTGRNQHEPGAKLDAGKPRVSLVLNGFPNALMAVAEVGTYGANKYTDNGWLSVPNGKQRYADAGYRHNLLAATGEDRDAESGLLHKAHAAWNALAELELMLREIQAPTADSEGWIPWSGGACPVPVQIRTRIKLSCGFEFETSRPRSFNWTHRAVSEPESNANIIAYRVEMPARDF